jgi:membrane protein YdbS with pleckstrin-like domain
VTVDDQPVPRYLAPSLRLLDGETMLLALGRTSWLATFYKIVTLGLYSFWWRVSWFVVTDRRLIAKQGIFNKTEIALPLHFVQDASVHRTWLGVGRVDVSTAGGSDGNLSWEPLRAEHARQLADTILPAAKRAGGGARIAAATDAVTDNLVRLAALRDSGALTEEEFALQKARLLGSQ